MRLHLYPITMAVAVAVLCGGCVGRQSKEASIAPAAEVGTEYNQYPNEIATNGPWDESWWKSFNDKVLDALIEAGLENNFDLQSFVYRIEQATALARQSGARLFPAIDLSASDRYEWDDLIAVGENKDREERTAIGGALRWELDLFGRLSAARRARVLQREASVQDWLDARLLLSGAIAETYFETKEQKRQLEVILEQIEINESLLKLTTLRFGQGQSSIVDVLQQQEQLDETKARVPQTEARIAQLEYTLDVLLGNAPGEGDFVNASSFANLPAMPAVGIPADLLQRRPDLRAAEKRLLALDERLGEAVADQLPSIVIGGGVDWRGDPRLGDAIRSAFASLSAPLFAAGERRAEVSLRRAELEEGLARYTEQFINAVLEVESILVLERKLLERLELEEKQLFNAQRLLTEARNRFSQGLTDYLPVFTSLNIVQNLERQIVSARRDVLSARISLHRALGGPIASPESVANLSTQ